METSEADVEELLLSGSAILEKDALLIRDAFQRKMDAADPIPGVEKQRRLVRDLREAAELEPVARRARLKELKDAPALIERIAKGLAGPSVDNSKVERAARKAAARTLSELANQLRSL